MRRPDALHERNIRALQALPRPVTVLTTHSAWLLSSLVHGLQRAAVGRRQRHRRPAGRAVRARCAANDLAAARAINDRIYPIAQAFYAPPFLDMHNRMKEVLALLGRLPPAVVRPPLVKLPTAEIERLRQAIAAAGLDRDDGRTRSPPNEPADRAMDSGLAGLVAAETVLSHSDGAARHPVGARPHPGRAGRRFRL